MYFTK